MARGPQWWWLGVLLVLGGCQPAPSTVTAPKTSATLPSELSAPGAAAKTATELRPVLAEMAGIPIPRVKVPPVSAANLGPPALDVGNPHAKTSDTPTPGGQIVVRFESEPKTLNPVNETSAVKTFMAQYVQEPLMWRDPVTLEYTPWIAKSCANEDSIKLSANFPGRERRVALARRVESTWEATAADAAALIEVNWPAAATALEKSTVLGVRTFDQAGQPLAGVWVGLLPKAEHGNSYHVWSRADGYAEFEGVLPGEYMLHTGEEVFGKVSRGDGTLTIQPLSKNNPIANDPVFAGPLAADQVTDVQASTVYTYELRDDVTWSDGTPFTSRDLEFAYAVINNEFVDGESIRTYYADLVECRSLGPHGVRMKYRQQYFLGEEFCHNLSFYAPPFHQFEALLRSPEEGAAAALTLDRLTPAEEEAQQKVSVHGQRFGKFFNTDRRYNQQPLGTGPYAYGNWEVADRLELTRRTNYWNTQRAGYLDRIVIKFIPDNVTALQALKAGQVDFMQRMGVDQYFLDLDGPPEWFEKSYVKSEWFVPMYSYIGWNSLKPLFNDPKVRMALTLLIDRPTFVEKKMYKTPTLVSGSQYIFGPMYDHSVPPVGFDPDTAKDLLAEAGWLDSNGDGVLDKQGQDFRFTFMYPQGVKLVDDLAAQIQRSLKDAGLDMQIQTIEWATFIEKLHQKDFDAVTLSWSMDFESDPYQIWHGSQAGAGRRSSNHVSFSNPEADRLIERMRVTIDKNARKELNSQFHRLLDSEQPYTFLWTRKEFGAYNHRYRGVKWYRVRPGFDLAEWYIPKELQ